MQHTIEDLIEKINAMHDMAIKLHRERNRYSDLSSRLYDRTTCQHLIDQIQSMALEIAHDRQGEDVKTRMDEWKK